VELVSDSLSQKIWCDFDHESLATMLCAGGCSAANVPQVLRAWYRHNGCLDEWTAARIGPRVKALINQRVVSIASQIRRRHESADGTVKLLIDFCASPQSEIGVPQSTECVLMPAYRGGRAMACVSSQIGCAMGCEFCASTQNGLQRNLTAAEIVEQFVHLQSEARQQQRRITSLVFMGMGEPMHNLPEVIPAIRRIAHPDMGGVGWRQVTVSTVGIVPGIHELAEADLNVHLALSLHAADDDTRSRIVPMNRKYNIEAVLTAAKNFYERSGRIVTIEWCLIDGINDSDEHADRLAALLRRFEFLRAAHVNIIPFNPITPGPRGPTFARPTPMRVKQFIERLQVSNVVCHRRDTRGDDVSAACGQLRRLEVLNAR
jgi:23S rRNA (adenine2503-C2)-methyltransferase